MKNNVSIFADIFHKHINRCKVNFQNSDNLKVAEVVPILKKAPTKDSKNLKSGYWPVSKLPNVSKLLEKSVHDQRASFFDNIFSKYQFRFEKGYSVQQCSVALERFWKMSVTNEEVFWGSITVPSKVFDHVNHELLITRWLWLSLPDVKTHLKLLRPSKTKFAHQ